MQGLAGVDPSEFLAAGQEPLMKFEIYVDDVWKNICDIIERVTDGGFESWLDATDLKYWTESISGSSTINRESSIIHGGTYSLKFDIDAAKSLVSVTQNITLIPGASYLLTFWYKGSTSPGTLLHLSLVDSGNNKWLDSSGDWENMGFYDGGFTRSNQTEWTLCSIAFDAHASYSNYVLAVKSCVHGGGVASAQVYIDDLSIVEVLEFASEAKGNYLESASVSLGGASMTPNPVAGNWNAMLFNESGIFHPQHPDSELRAYIETGRKARISVGAKYGDVDYYWQRIIGYMNIPKFSTPDYKVAISGGDYMKFLKETEFRSFVDGVPDNYWGHYQDFTSWPSDGIIGAEIYDGQDAMDAVNEEDDVGGWVFTRCTFESFEDDGGESEFVGKMTNILGSPPVTPHAKKLDVGDAEEGHEYRVRFKHRSVGMGDVAGIRMEIWQASGGCKSFYCYPTDDWTEETFYFTALDTGVIEMRLYAAPTHTDLRWDQFSIQEFIPYEDRHYELTHANQKGPYHVTIDEGVGHVPVWQGEEDEGWWYEEDTNRVFFDINKVVAKDLPIRIYYYLPHSPEDVMADLLWKCGLYVNRAAVDAVFSPSATGLEIDKVWFEAGTTYLDAAKKLCEVCDRRFYFKYNGIPDFESKPTEADPADFIFTDPKHIASATTYQSWNEIKNRIVIKGLKRAEPVGREETMPSDLEGEAHNQVSIDAYGERTLTIDNEFFQDQTELDTMCDDLLTEYKDPDWYADLKVPFNPIPLEIGDTIQWEERLSRTGVDTVVDITKKGIIRDIKITNFDTIYKCVLIL